MLRMIWKAAPNPTPARRLWPVLIALTLVAALALGACSGSGGQAASGELDPNETLAVVNGTEITAADLYQAMLADSGIQTLNNLITETLILQEADRQQVIVADDELATRLDELREEYGGADSFAYILAQSGMTEEDLKEQIRINLLVEKMLEPTLDLGDDAVRAHYESNPDTYVVPDRVHTRHILVNTEDEALEILAELEQGGNFAELARERSVDPSAAQNEGDLGWRRRGELVDEYFDAAFEAGAGQRVGPVESPFGFHVIQVVEREAGRTQPLEEVFDQVRRSLMDSLLQANIGPWIQALYADAEIDNRLETGGQ